MEVLLIITHEVKHVLWTGWMFCICGYVNKESNTVATKITHTILYLWFCYDVPKAHVRSETVLKFCKICWWSLWKARKGIRASKTPKSMLYSYNANFRLMVIKHTEETGKCAVVWILCVMEQNVWQWRKQKLPLFKGVNSNTKKNFLGPRWTI